MATFLLYNSTLPDSEFREIGVNKLALNIVLDATAGALDSMAEVSLSSLLFGVLTILSLTSMFFLIRRRSFARLNTKILILSTILLYLSTGTYVASLMWNRWQAHHLVLGAINRGSSPSYDGHREMESFKGAIRKQSWMAVIALEVNCSIGDAIVWWRMCVIWRNKVVYCIGPPLISLILGMSLPVRFFLTHCPLSSDNPTVFGFIGYHEPQIPRTTGVTLLDTSNAFVRAAGIVSLATNALATILIAYKAWKHRQLVKTHFASAGTKSSVLNVLALLIESGSIYCALLTFVVFYKADQDPSYARVGRIFTRVAAYFVYGCLQPLMAIYPTIIIVIVALKRSPIDTGGLSQVYQVHGHGASSDGPADNGLGDANATIVFHHSTFCSSAVGDMESGMEESTQAGDHGSSRPPSSMSEGHAKDQDLGVFV